MDKDFYTNEFEQSLRELTEEYKMYPSESVWSNIFNKLHPGRRWGIIGGSMLVLLFTASVLVLRTANHSTAVKQKPASTQNKEHVSYTNNDNTGEPLIKNNIRHVNEHLKTNNAPDTRPAVIAVNIKQYEPEDIFDKLITAENIGNIKLPFTENFNTPGNSSDEKESSSLQNFSLTKVAGASKSNTIFQSPVYLEALFNPKTRATFNSSKKKSRFEWQLYFAPSVSYRKLFNDDNPASLAFAFSNFIPGDINKAVNHKPALGFELGNAVLFSLTKGIKIKAGVQLNYSRYNIKAYSTNTELTTIRLRGDHNQLQELRVASSFKNYGIFYQSTTISSQNVAVSVPFGVDLKMLGYKNISWYVSGSLQPTYILNNKAYLITNDLKNYVRNPDLFRKFTMNSGIETFLRIERNNGVALQVGPQLRYQINSSYTTKYPIREHLVEYGVKVGITKRF